MNCERIQESLLDFEAGALSSEVASQVREHLSNCPVCQREWADLKDTLSKLDAWPEEKPSERLRTNFYKMLEGYRDESAAKSSLTPAPRRSRGLFRWIWPVSPAWQFAAAVALLAGGMALGARFWPHGPSAHELATAAQLTATRQELAELRAKVDSVDRLLTTSLAQSEQPAQTRLKQVIATLNNSQADDQTLAQLLSTLAFDRNTNVRLSALEALYAYADKPAVRQGVLAALPKEASPLVQVAMIDFVVSMKDRTAAPTLEQLARTPTADTAVRAAAERGLAML
jgi:flagellar motility protein MotE (MotC chaperone)